MQVGDLVKFRHIYRGCDLNDKRALYLGEAFIYRDDDIVVENHKVLEIGASKPTIIDSGLLKYMSVVEPT